VSSRVPKPKALLIDALGAPDQSGGMQLVAGEIIRNWPANTSAGRTVVVGPSWIKKLVISNPNSIFIFWPNKNPILRILGQMIFVPLVGVVVRAKNYLALNCVISPLLWGRDTTVIAHDWRHVMRPNEFSSFQLFYRKIWKSSAKHSKKIIAVSSKTSNETKQITRRTDVVEWGLGGDHPAGWNINQHELVDLQNNVLTFGLHTNKRPDLVISAFLLARQENLIPESSRLTVLGLNLENADPDMKQLAEKFPGTLYFPGFVDSGEYQNFMAGSRFTVLASSDEGYGLPVVESAYWGKRTLVSDDSGLKEIHGDLVITAAPSVNDFSLGIANMWGIHQGLVINNKSWKQAAQELHDIVMQQQ
jgi:glycosyltransferase involved in cell wall biosynthesis